MITVYLNPKFYSFIIRCNSNISLLHIMGNKPWKVASSCLRIDDLNKLSSFYILYNEHDILYDVHSDWIIGIDDNRDEKIKLLLL